MCGLKRRNGFNNSKDISLKGYIYLALKSGVNSIGRFTINKYRGMFVSTDDEKNVQSRIEIIKI